MNTPKPKLLYIINHMDWFWSHRLPLAIGAQKEGWDVLVAATGASTDTKLPENNFTGIELPASTKGFMPLAILKTILSIRKTIQTEKPDLLHAITLKYCFFAGLAALGTNTKIVHTIAGLGYLFSGENAKPQILRALIGPFLKLALKGKNTTLIFQNPDDMQLLLGCNFARKEQCHLIRGSGVDTTEFTPAPDPSTIDKDATPIIVMPTRLVHDKGVAIFVEAARILKKRGIEAKFQIAGGITEYNPLAITKEQMEDMVADGAAQWLGKVTDMPALFAGATLIVYPSYYREGIPKVLLEAAAMGKAIITTDHPGCREAVNDTINGLLTPVKDAESTANAAEVLLKDQKTRIKMGKESRKRAETEFDVRIIVKSTLKLYKSA